MTLFAPQPTASPVKCWKAPALFQGARWQEVAKKIGIFALATFVIVGTLACLIFIPGAPLFAFAGTAILLGLTGSLTGTAAVAAAVCLPVITYIAWNAAFATGAILGEKHRHEEELSAIRERKRAQPLGCERVADQLPHMLDPETYYRSVQRVKKKDKEQSNFNPSQETSKPDFSSPTFREESTPARKPVFSMYQSYPTISPLLQLEVSDYESSISTAKSSPSTNSETQKPKYPSDESTKESSDSNSPPTPPSRLSQEDLNPPANSEDEDELFKKDDDKNPSLRTKDPFNNETIQLSEDEERFEDRGKIPSSPKTYGRLAPKTPPDPNSYGSSPE